VRESDIEAFVAVCKYMNFTKAAEALYVSQPSLSAKISSLEKELGCVLFERSKGQKTISLTPEGERLESLATQYEYVLKQMSKVARDSRSTILRISVIDSVSTYMFLPVYETFIKKYPEVRFIVQEDMTTVVASKSISMDKTDLAFITRATDASVVKAIPAFSERMCFICPINSKYPQKVSLDMIKQEEEIYVKWGGELGAWHNEMFGSAIKPKIRLEAMEQLHHFVSKGESWAIVPICVAKNFEARGKIRICNTDFDIPRRDTKCIYSLRRDLNSTMKAFLKCAYEVIKCQWKDEDVSVFDTLNV